MADERKFPLEVEFFFETDKDYRIIASNGAWGGITPQGDIQVDFFVERLATPESVKNSVSEEGAIGTIIEMKPPKRIVRRLQVGVLMTVEQSQKLAKFLSEKIKQVEDIKKGNV
jgi:hypothetical protein